MSNPIEDLIDDMLERCENLMILTRVDVEAEEHTEACGILIVDHATGNTIALEAGMDIEGHGTVTLRAFDSDTLPVEPTLIQVGDSIMINTN